jgi:hypothetical protein
MHNCESPSKVDVATTQPERGFRGWEGEGGGRRRPRWRSSEGRAALRPPPGPRRQAHHPPRKLTTRPAARRGFRHLHYLEICTFPHHCALSIANV